MKRMLTAIVCLALCVAASNPGLPDEIKFATDDGELVWPLPDSDDLVNILIHAVHCKHIVELNYSKTAMDRMHVKHCAKVVDTINAQQTPDVSKPICQLLFGDATEYFSSRAKLGSYSYADKKGQEGSEKYYADRAKLGSYSYADKKGQEGSEKYYADRAKLGSYSYADKKGQEGSEKYYADRAKLGSYSYTKPRVHRDATQAADHGEVLDSPRADLVHLAGTNYGKLLMKEWANSPTDPLTAAEKAYLDSWYSKTHMTQAGLAYRCEALGVPIYTMKDEPKEEGH